MIGFGADASKFENLKVYIMKNAIRNLLIVYLNLISMILVAQTGINYQGVLRNSQRSPIANAAIDIRFRILLQEGPSGKMMYEEEHLDLETSELGVFHALIGSENQEVYIDLQCP